MKGCLKSPHRPGFRRSLSVCFGDGEQVAQQVFIADEWDRTPTEPAKKLSYQDLLELKEIQRSLPIADQPPDPISGKPPSRYLGKVPIGLLPLLPQDCPVSSPTSPPAPSPQCSSPQRSTASASQEFIPTFKRTQKPNLTRWTPPPPPPIHFGPATSSYYPCTPSATYTYLPHLPRPSHPQQQPKPKFAFLPLLDSSLPPAEEDEEELTETESQPTTPSLTNASLTSSPNSRPQSPSGELEPSFFQLPPPRRVRRNGEGYFSSSSECSGDDEDYSRERERAERWFRSAKGSLKAIPSPGLVPPSPLMLGPSGGDREREREAGRKKKKRNVIVVNDVEIEIEEEDETPTRSPVLSPSSNSRRSPPASPSSPTPALYAPVQFKRTPPAPPPPSFASPTSSPTRRPYSPTTPKSRHSPTNSISYAQRPASTAISIPHSPPSPTATTTGCLPQFRLGAGGGGGGKGVLVPSA